MYKLLEKEFLNWVIVDYNNYYSLINKNYEDGSPINIGDKVIFALLNIGGDEKEITYKLIIIKDSQIDSYYSIIENKNQIPVLKKRPTKLSEIENGDKIFCINFNETEIYVNDYFDIIFYEPVTVGSLSGFTKFKTYNNELKTGCLSYLKTDLMENHCFLSDLSSSFYFFTLNPQSWKEDLLLEINKFIRNKQEEFDKKMKITKQSLFGILQFYDKL